MWSLKFLLHEDEVFQDNVDDKIQDDIAVTCSERTRNKALAFFQPLNQLC